MKTGIYSSAPAAMKGAGLKKTQKTAQFASSILLLAMLMKRWSALCQRRKGSESGRAGCTQSGSKGARGLGVGVPFLPKCRAVSNDAALDVSAASL